MLWKFLGLQKMIDALFDEGWCGLGLPEALGPEIFNAQELIAGESNPVISL